MEATAVFAATFAALYAGHHVGDYWAQTDHQARHKGARGPEGVIACLTHVMAYITVQFVCLILMGLATGWDAADGWWALLALAVSGVTHYAADRREHGLMFRVARLLPAVTEGFMKLGAPRSGVHIETWVACPDCVPGGRCGTCQGGGRVLGGAVGDNPSLGTGTWALDQAWHIALGVFVPALILAAAA
jgi:hypothetical protein